MGKAVTQIEGVTQQNAALVEQAAAASEAIVEQAKALNSVIARYKINDAAQPANPAVQPAAPARSSERRGRDRAWSKTKAAIAPSAPLAAVSNGDSEWSEF
jgi:methyl-accepting chemotaxis protein